MGGHPALIAVHGVGVLRRELGTCCGLGLVEKLRHILIARWVRFLARQDIIGLVICHDLGPLWLTPHGITRPDDTHTGPYREEGGNSGDCVGLLLHCALAPPQTIGTSPRPHHRDGGWPSGTSKRVPQRFAVDGHASATRGLAQGLRPRAKAPRPFLGVEPR